MSKLEYKTDGFILKGRRRRRIGELPKHLVWEQEHLSKEAWNAMVKENKFKIQMSRV